jgi:hypothetical protein
MITRNSSFRYSALTAAALCAALTASPAFAINCDEVEAAAEQGTPMRVRSVVPFGAPGPYAPSVVDPVATICGQGLPAVTTVDRAAPDRNAAPTYRDTQPAPVFERTRAREPIQYSQQMRSSVQLPSEVAAQMRSASQQIRGGNYHATRQALLRVEDRLIQVRDDAFSRGASEDEILSLNRLTDTVTSARVAQQQGDRQTAMTLMDEALRSVGSQ